MIFMIVIAVFIGGLLVGRTPEYLGTKIESRQIKLAAIGALFVPVLALTLTAIAIASPSGLKSVFNPGAHGFMEALYAWTSMANTNGSAFAGYGATNFSAELGAIAMILGRYVPMLAALALAGSVATKRRSPAGAGTLRTDGPTFAFLLVGVIALEAGLMLLPALALGPFVEGLVGQ
jgi:K+-transporting ATPase ATPase A chain